MSAASIHPTTLNLNADRHIARWRPFVQWILAIPHLLVVRALQAVRGLLTLVSLVTVVFTGRIPCPLFDAIAMTYRYEWRTVSYALFLHGDYPPFDFMPSALDDGQQPTGSLTFAYPDHLNRWKPLYKWFLAIPHYVVCIALAIASVLTIVWGAIAILVTGQYPERARSFLVGSYRYRLRLQAYIGLLTDEYPPFHLAA
jgi:bacteriorhodopsin